jgi:S1-C subfamily serine protease
VKVLRSKPIRRGIVALFVLLLAFPGTAGGQSGTLSAVSPWVVTVFQTEGKRVSLGTGFIDANGYVITAAHVILQSRLPVYLGRQGRMTPDRLRRARVLRINRDADVAILDAGYDPVGLRFRDFPAQAGDEVWTFGYEFLNGVAILRMARASIGQRWQDLFQIDGAVQPGFSGGPVTTRGGRVVGMLSFGSILNPNLAYLVPAHVLREELAALPPRAPAVAPALTSARAPAVAMVSDHTIVPGTRVGPIWLGMSLTDAIRAMGRSYDNTGRSVAGTSTFYAWNLDRGYYHSSLIELALRIPPAIMVWIDDAGSTATQIDVTAARFVTRGGNGVGNIVYAFVREFGPPTFETRFEGGDLLWRFGPAGLSIVFQERDRLVHS